MSAAARPAERRVDARQQPHRPQVDVLLEALAERKDQLARRNVIRHARIADRAQVDGVELAHLLEPVGVHHPAVPQVEIASPRKLGEIAAEVPLRRRHLHHLDAGGNDFLVQCRRRQ